MDKKETRLKKERKGKIKETRLPANYANRANVFEKEKDKKRIYHGIFTV